MRCEALSIWCSRSMFWVRPPAVLRPGTVPRFGDAVDRGSNRPTTMPNGRTVTCGDIWRQAFRSIGLLWARLSWREASGLLYGGERSRAER